MTYVEQKGFQVDRLFYNFVSKKRLLEMNQEYLNHETHTDIITFDYSTGKMLSAEFFISMWAVEQSAKEESQTLEDETLRVISHGVLHCMGYEDGTQEKKAEMRQRENEFINLFHVKQLNNV